MDLHSISLFSGVGMLDEGLRAGLAYLGLTHRTVCHVEREAHGASVLAARMEEGSMDAAPVWSDVLTFDARAWRGRVDCIVAGFPCQDLSVAGRRAGLDGSRSGLFFEVVRIATDSGAWCMFLENVAGIATATATVVDAEEGELDERAAARVVGELADLGWDAEWVTLSASDVGASHGRARWFCFAWRRMGHTDGGFQGPVGAIPRGADAEPAGTGELRGVADTGGHGRQRRKERDIGTVEPGQRAPLGRDLERRDSDVADPGCRDVRRVESEPVGGRGDQAGDHAGRAAGADAGPARRGLASGGDEPGQRCVEEQGGTRHGECGRDAVGRPEIVGGALADPSEPRLPEPERGELRGAGRRIEGRAAEQLRGAPLLFAPGPADPRWPAILAEHPELAPALEPSFRSVVDGLAFDMGDSRAARLKCVGNGVVPLCAAAAFVELVQRARGVMANCGQLKEAA